MRYKSSPQRNKGTAIDNILNNYVMLDIETTGFSPINDKIIELAALKVVNNNVVDTFQTLVDPMCEISPRITGLTGIDNSMVNDKPCIKDVLPSFIDFVGDNIIVGHNVSFDINFIYDNCARHFGTQFSNDFQDTLTISRRLFPNLSSHRLSFLITQFNIVNESAHRALSDCYATYELYCYIQKYLMVKDMDLRMVLSSRAKRRSKPKKPTTKMAPSVQDFDIENPLFNKTVVFTGTMDCLVRSDAIQLVLDNGGICPSTVTKCTDILVLGNTSYNAYKTRNIKSNKIKKAEANIAKGQKLDIISEQTFISYFNESTKSNIYRNEYIIDTTAQSIDNDIYDQLSTPQKDIIRKISYILYDLDTQYLRFEIKKNTIIVRCMCKLFEVKVSNRQSYFKANEQFFGDFDFYDFETSSAKSDPEIKIHIDEVILFELIDDLNSNIIQSYNDALKQINVMLQSEDKRFASELSNYCDNAKFIDIKQIIKDTDSLESPVSIA